MRRSGMHLQLFWTLTQVCSSVFLLEVEFQINARLPSEEHHAHRIWGKPSRSSHRILGRPLPPPWRRLPGSPAGPADPHPTGMRVKPENRTGRRSSSQASRVSVLYVSNLPFKLLVGKTHLTRWSATDTFLKTTRMLALEAWSPTSCSRVSESYLKGLWSLFFWKLTLTRF